jgi:hypothetical protein
VEGGFVNYYKRYRLRKKLGEEAVPKLQRGPVRQFSDEERRIRKNEARRKARAAAKAQTKIIPFEMTADRLAKMQNFLKFHHG